MTTSFDQRDDTDRRGLQWIARFIWLRSAELGRLLWPKDTHSRVRADRIIRGWLERRLVLARPLPDGAGRCVVLSGTGAALLRQHGIEASTGKEFGEKIRRAGTPPPPAKPRPDDMQWLPPNTWKHTLLATGVLVRLHERGYEILTEIEIKQQADKDLTKIPDGLAWRADEVIWLEVERSSKDGKYMGALADVICAVSDGTCKPVDDHKPTKSMITYDIAAKDSRGYALDHRARVLAAVRKKARRSTLITWSACTLAGHGVASVKEDQETISPDRAGAILDCLNASGWRNDTESGCLAATYGAWRVFVWEEDTGWGYCINAGNGEDDKPGDITATRAQAQLAGAEALVTAGA